MSTVAKALDIIEAISKHKDGVSLSDLAAQTRLNRTTVYRILSVLASRGYVYQQGKKGKYTFGLSFLQYSDITNAATSIKDKALPYMHNLCNEISETVNMAILDGIDAIGISVIAADRILQVVPSIINKYPLHCTSIGKVLLASMPQEKIDRVINVTRLEAYTDNTITDAARMKAELETIRQDGAAFDDEEYMPGIRSAAAPLKGENGDVLAAISFVGPTVRIGKSRLVQLTPMLKNYALDISFALGYTGN